MGNKIIRRPDFAGGGLTDEERERMAQHTALWIQRAMRTESADPVAIEAAIKGLYRISGLAEPRVILVPSPFVMAMAGGIAATFYATNAATYAATWVATNDATDAATEDATEDATRNVTWVATRAATRAATDAATEDATRDATRDATYDATNAATRVATYDATWAATDDATYDATWAATKDATRNVTWVATRAATRAATDAATWAATNAATEDATRDATRDATYDATWVATNDATDAATEDATEDATRAATNQWRTLAASFVGERYADAALNAAKNWTVVYQGGNMWAAWDCYLTACRDILGLRLPSHDAYAYWEQAAINGGFRWMHPKFCLVSDFPEILRVNSQNQPHAEFGPSHRWRDGFSIWHLNGVRVEQWMAESHPDDLDARRVLQIENVDQRREVIRRMGSERLVAQLDATVLDVETREVGGRYELLAIDMNHGEPWRFLKMVNQSIGAVHVEAVPRQCETVRHAINWRASQDINQDWFPSQLT